ncbi:MAG: SDR family oxidoreductase [Woeseiaceae bacterium]|nr:SDR family oxidoreductase [Woeseiaceae bacterium]
MSKKILITGCSSGFGLDAAKTLAKKGHEVFATMRDVGGRNAPKAQELRDFAAAEGVSISVLEMDVTSDASVRSAVDGIGTVDVLINNAGLGYGGPVESFEGEEILAQLDLNIVGTARASNAVLPGMRAQGDGLIIQVSSTAGRAGFPGFGVYHASKWGLEGMSEGMRYELAPLGIDVVIVEPGPFATNFFENMKQGSRQDVMSDYGHIGEFFTGFQGTVMELFENEEAPTDPHIVVDVFDRLIDTPKGERPFRTIAGLDFGVQALNDAAEPIRKAGLESMGIADWDGPKA